MKLNDVKDLKGCVRNDISCKFLVTTFSFKPLQAFCSIGNECGRAYCCYHLDNDKGLTLEEMMKEENIAGK